MAYRIAWVKGGDEEERVHSGPILVKQVDDKLLFKTKDEADELCGKANKHFKNGYRNGRHWVVEVQTKEATRELNRLSL